MEGAGHSRKRSLGRELGVWSLLLALAGSPSSASEPANSPSEAGEVRVGLAADGPELRARVTGEGSPAVVCDTGMGDDLTAWRDLPEELARHTRVVTYDRAGLGESTLGGENRSAAQVARELRALLDALEIQPPFVLVGHSLAGLHLLLFADLYPQDVAGLVFLDPTTAGMFQSLETEEGWELYKSKAADYPPGLQAEAFAFRDKLREVRALGTPPDVPMVVVSGAAPPFIPEDQREAMAAEGLTEEVWRDLQKGKIERHRALAAKFPGGRMVLAPEAHHYVHHDQPELVIAEILKVLAATEPTP